MATTNADHPSDAWTALQNAATLGLDRAGAAATAVSGAPWSLASAVGEADPIQSFLREVSALACYELAGREPPRATDGDNIQPCEPDERECSRAAGNLLNEVLHGDRGDLLLDWCAAAGPARQIAPPELLPSLLRSAATIEADEPRAQVLAVIGHRGRWLARQNPEWQSLAAVESSATPDTPSPAQEEWETGKLQERLALLRRVRGSDPARARELVTAVWDEEAAADRAAMLEQFVVGLGDEDEAWLEARLDDRSKLVRVAAAALLSRLPRSALAGRMTERVRASVRYVPASGLIRNTPHAIEVTLPEKADAAMQRDGLEAKARLSMGPKAALLNQIVAHTPLDVWLAECPDMARWIDAAMAGSWGEPLIDGWTTAAALQQNAAWAEALLTRVCLVKAGEGAPPSDPWRCQAIPRLVGALSREAATALATRALTDSKQETPPENLDALLLACDFAWDERLSMAAIALVRRRLQNTTNLYDYSLKHLVESAVQLRLTPSLADQLASLLPQQLDGWTPSLINLVQNLIETVRFRRDMLAAFPK